jgi:hypothetical protein
MPRAIGQHQGLQAVRFLHWVYLLFALATGFAVYRWAATGDAVWLGAAVVTGLLTIGALVDLILVFRSLP